MARGGSIGTTTFNFTVTSFFPPPLDWPPGPGPASVPFTGLPAPPPVGVVMPVLPPPEPIWSPGGQNSEAMPSRTFASVEQPSDLSSPWPSCPLEPLSLPVNKMSVSRNLTERLIKVADELERSIEERKQQADLVDILDEPAPREAILSRTFTSVEEADIVQDPSDLPLEPLSLPVKKLLAVGHNFAERLTKVADNLESD